MSKNKQNNSDGDNRKDLVGKVSKATPEGVDAIEEAVSRVIGQLEFGPDERPQSRRRKPSDPKSQLPPPARPQEPEKFSAHTEIFALHKSKQLSRYLEILNGPKTSRFVRSINWGTRGKCWALLEWTEKQDATPKQS